MGTKTISETDRAYSEKMKTNLSGYCLYQEIGALNQQKWPYSVKHLLPQIRGYSIEPSPMWTVLTTKKQTSPVKRDQIVAQSREDVGHLRQQARIAGSNVLIHLKTSNFVQWFQLLAFDIPPLQVQVRLDGQLLRHVNFSRICCICNGKASEWLRCNRAFISTTSTAQSNLVRAASQSPH